MSGNLKIGPKSKGKVWEFLENGESEGKVREFFQSTELQTKYLKFLMAF